MGKLVRRTVVTGAVVGLSALGLVGCSSTQDDQREALQEQKDTGATLEKANLEEKRRREEDANAIGYVYLMNYGNVVGYYVTKGKISSSGSQATPQDEIHWTCRVGDCMPVVVDGPQDDGSYGDHDPGIFFFLSDGTKVVTDLDYIHTDRPIPALNAPDLGAQ